MDKIHLLIVDDQKLFGEGLAQVIQRRTNDIVIEGILSNGEDAVKYVSAGKEVNLILMDIRMPVMDGVEATRLIHSMNKMIKILVLTTFNEDEYVSDALRYGASGYILKDIEPDLLIKNIMNIFNGMVLLSPEIVDMITNREKTIESTKLQSKMGSQQYRTLLMELKEKEKQMLPFIAKGWSNKAIAEVLYLGSQTVRNYMSDIYEKLQVKDRFEAIQKCKEIISLEKDHT